MLEKTQAAAVQADHTSSMQLFHWLSFQMQQQQIHWLYKTMIVLHFNAVFALANATSANPPRTMASWRVDPP